VPVILVTHDRLDAIALADLAIVIADGSVRQIGPLHDVFAHPADSTVAGIVGVESLLPGELVHSADGIAHVRVGPVAITALSPLTHRQPVVVCIRAEDVLLETTTATHSSARNRLPGQVRHVRAEGPVYRVTLDVGFPLDALITRSARDELQLEPGDSILALVKAHAVHLVPHT
jgi:molybdate transport system ATP-binding protein